MFDMIGGIGVGLGMLSDCWGACVLKGEMGDTATP